MPFFCNLPRGKWKMVSDHFSYPWKMVSDHFSYPAEELGNGVGNGAMGNGASSFF
jgi:hypothetical protein